jgi:hypothetical protein
MGLLLPWKNLGHLLQIHCKKHWNFTKQTPKAVVIHLDTLLAIFERCITMSGHATRHAQYIAHEVKKHRAREHKWGQNSWLGKYELLFTHTSKKPHDVKETEKLTKLKDLCHESLSVHNHRHGNNNFEKNYHSWIGVNHGIVHQASQLTSIKGGMWIFQVAKM